MSDTIAVVFDFDDTLVPDSTTMLLENHGIDPKKFWKTDLERLVKDGYDPTLGFLRLVLDNVGPGKPFGQLSNNDLRKFGKTLDKHLYPGLPRVLTDLRKEVAKVKTISIEFYIVSGGLQAIIEGTTLATKHFTAVYGCQFDEVGNPPVIRHIKRCINFTEKTKYLFEINKGITTDDSRKNPHAVNREVPDDKRHVPFANMIYIGDGLTDIPCFSLLKRYGGTPFGVFDPGNPAKAKQAFTKFLQEKRVVGMHAPKYGPNTELGALLRAAVATKINGILLDRGIA